MPGSPATSPRLGIPRYADGDTAAFSSQVNGVTDQVDSTVAKRANVQAVVAGATPTDAEVAVTAGGVTLTLNASPTVGDVVRVVADDSATGTNQVTIQAQGGATIHGRGIGSSGVTSIVLGTPGAYVELACVTATKWQIVGGEQDTGWLALTLGTASFSGDSRTPSARLTGNRVQLRGVLTASGGTPTTWATVPAGCRPAVNTAFPVASALNNGADGILISTAGAITLRAATANGMWLDGVNYSLS